jgi:hypothetical protein
VDQGPQPRTAHVMTGREHTQQQDKGDGPATLAYALFSGLGALGAGAVASFAASSAQVKLVVWSIVTGITAIAAGAAYESRRVRGLSRLVAAWIQAAQRP